MTARSSMSDARTRSTNQSVGRADTTRTRRSLGFGGLSWCKEGRRQGAQGGEGRA
jgi:hypothetical protein